MPNFHAAGGGLTFGKQLLAGIYNGSTGTWNWNPHGLMMTRLAVGHYELTHNLDLPSEELPMMISLSGSSLGRTASMVGVDPDIVDIWISDQAGAPDDARIHFFILNPGEL